MKLKKVQEERDEKASDDVSMNTSEPEEKTASKKDTSKQAERYLHFDSLVYEKDFRSNSFHQPPYHPLLPHHSPRPACLPTVHGSCFVCLNSYLIKLITSVLSYLSPTACIHTHFYLPSF